MQQCVLAPEDLPVLHPNVTIQAAAQVVQELAGRQAGTVGWLATGRREWGSRSKEEALSAMAGGGTYQPLGIHGLGEAASHDRCRMARGPRAAVIRIRHGRLVHKNIAVLGQLPNGGRVASSEGDWHKRTDGSR